MLPGAYVRECQTLRGAAGVETDGDDPEACEKSTPSGSDTATATINATIVTAITSPRAMPQRYIRDHEIARLAMSSPELR